MLRIVYNDYKHLIKPESMVKIYLKGTVLDTNKSYARQDTFTFSKPPLEIQVYLQHLKCHENENEKSYHLIIM